MENKQNYYSNFKCFCKKGRRIALFGRQSGSELEIFELYCSKSNSFKKLTAKVVYDCYIRSGLKGIPTKFHPIIYTIPLEGNKPLWTFNNHCKNNYYHKQTITCLYNVEMLKKDFEMKIVNVTKKKVKI